MTFKENYKITVSKKLKLCCHINKIVVGNSSRYKDIPHVCYACDSTETAHNKNGGPRWNLNIGEDRNLIGMLCKRCYNRIISNPALRAKGYYKQLINFKGKEKLMKTNPRKGICQQCGKQGLYSHTPWPIRWFRYPKIHAWVVP